MFNENSYPSYVDILVANTPFKVNEIADSEYAAEDVSNNSKNQNSHNLDINKENAAFMEAFCFLSPKQLKYFKEQLFPEVDQISDETFLDCMKDRIVNEPGCCAKCSSRDIVKNGRNRLNKQCYKCNVCGRNFCDSSTSLLSYSKKPVQKWLQYMECICEGLSIRACAVKVGISRNTSFHWRHKILYAVKKRLSDYLKGIVEIDEFKVIESFKGNHSKSKVSPLKRAPRERGVRPGSEFAENRVCILCCKDRNGSVFSEVLGIRRPSSAVLLNLLQSRIDKKSTICTNNNSSFLVLSKKLKVKIYKLKNDTEVVKNIYHIKNARAFGSEFQNFLFRFNGVATKYLNFYITWFKWLEIARSFSNHYKVADLFLLSTAHNSRLRVCDFNTIKPTTN